MDAHKFDRVAKLLGNGSSRRTLLKALAGTAAGGAVMVASTRVTSAAPRTCATCTCGVGRPCNPKQQFCVEVGRGFPTAEDQCSARCAQAGFKFCGAGSQFHCPRGCPA